MQVEFSTEISDECDAELLLIQTVKQYDQAAINYYDLVKELTLLKNELSLSMMFGQGSVSQELLEKIYDTEKKINKFYGKFPNAKLES